MDKLKSIIGIDFGVEKIHVSYYDGTCTEPLIIATINGYGVLSESSIAEAFDELKNKTGNAEAVMAIPAYFNMLQLKMISDAGKKAGIFIKRFVHKTCAAAITVEFDRNRKQRKSIEEIIVVCVFEKGLFEIALAELGGVVEVEIKAVDWEIDFNKKDIDSIRFNELCTNILAEQHFTLEQIDSVILAGDSDYLTTAHKLLLDYFKKEPVSIFDAEHVIAIGMSFLGAIISGNVKDIMVLEITSMSLGIEAQDGIMNKIIPRNTTIPTRKSKLIPIQTSSPTININLLQGEYNMASKNCHIGNFSLNVKPGPDGKRLIEVTMDIMADGVVTVNAKEIIGSVKTNTLFPIVESIVPPLWWVNEIDKIGKKKIAEKMARDSLLKEDPNFNDLPKREQKELIAKEIERQQRKFIPGGLVALSKSKANGEYSKPNGASVYD